MKKSNKEKGIIVKRTTIYPLTNFIKEEYLFHPQTDETKIYCHHEDIKHAFVFHTKSSLLKFHKAGVIEINSIFNGKGIEEVEHIFVEKQPHDEKYLYEEKELTQERKEYWKKIEIKFVFPKIPNNSSRKRDLLN
jgi:hypothetical protein